VVGRGDDLAQFGPGDGAADRDVDVRGEASLRFDRGEILSVVVLAATLSAHGSAAFDVHVLAGLGGDAVLAGSRSAAAVGVAAEEAGEQVDGFEQQRVDFGLLVSGVLGAVAGGEVVPPGGCLLFVFGGLVSGLVAGLPPAQRLGAGDGPAGGLAVSRG
jgi:hypothetical protein